VGPETNLGTIIEGNAARNGAQITLGFNFALMHVKVARSGVLGVPGKFKAIYRVFWEQGPDIPPQELRVTAHPYPVPLARSVQVTIQSVNTQTNEPVAGTVFVKNPLEAERRFPTNEPFQFTFRSKLVGPKGDRELVYPTGVVRAPGFSDAHVDFGFVE
jgi:hypothetical protein